MCFEIQVLTIVTKDVDSSMDWENFECVLHEDLICVDVMK